MFVSQYKVVILFLAVIHCWYRAPAQARKDSKVWERLAIRTIKFKEIPDTAIHHLRDESADTLLFELLLACKKSGKLPSYASANDGFHTKLRNNEFSASWVLPKPDTTIVIDPITGQELIAIVDHNPGISKYWLLEKWTFDTRTGNTKIKILGLAPVMDMEYNDRPKTTHPIFWLRYEDVKDIFARYEQYHPVNTISGNIWNDYFVNDAKPAVLR